MPTGRRGRASEGFKGLLRPTPPVAHSAIGGKGDANELLTTVCFIAFYEARRIESRNAGITTRTKGIRPCINSGLAGRRRESSAFLGLCLASVRGGRGTEPRRNLATIRKAKANIPPVATICSGGKTPKLGRVSRVSVSKGCRKTALEVVAMGRIASISGVV